MQSRSRQQGFTLLELLVVMVIIGIVVAAALLGTSFTNMDRRLKEEGQRFSALIRYARDEAILQTRELGLQVDETGYRFLFLDPLSAQWAPADFDEVLRARQFSEGISATLWVEGAGFELGNPDEAPPDPGALPQIFILSSGEVSPFEMVFEGIGADSRVRMRADITGNTETEVESAVF